MAGFTLAYKMLIDGEWVDAADGREEACSTFVEVIPSPFNNSCSIVTREPIPVGPV